MVSLMRLLSRLFTGRKFEGDGYVVRFATSWIGFVYEEADKKMKIYAERMIDEPGKRSHLAVYVSDLRWDPPNQFLVITDEKAKQINRRLEIALTQLVPGAELIG